MKASIFCQPALTCYETQGQYIEDITRWREDMNIRVVKTIFYEQIMLLCISLNDVAACCQTANCKCCVNHNTNFQPKYQNCLKMWRFVCRPRRERSGFF